MSKKLVLSILIILLIAVAGYYLTKTNTTERKETLDDSAQILPLATEEQKQNIKSEEPIEEPGDQSANPSAKQNLKDTELDQIEDDFASELESYQSDSGDIDTFDDNGSLDTLDGDLGGI